jgi:hypothetical protein
LESIFFPLTFISWQGVLAPKAALERAVDYVDYEDAVLALSMQHAAVRMLWTRNAKDFKEFASIAALSPEAYVAGLAS